MSKIFVCPCPRTFKKFSKYFSHCSKEHPEIEFVMQRPEFESSNHE